VKRLTNPHEYHEADVVRALRDFRDGRSTPHRDAFDVFLWRVGWAILRIESMLDEYLDALAEAGAR
jgi:hypothetical protein